jgi:hypothetical protein
VRDFKAAEGEGEVPFPGILPDMTASNDGYGTTILRRRERALAYNDRSCSISTRFTCTLRKMAFFAVVRCPAETWHVTHVTHATHAT